MAEYRPLCRADEIPSGQGRAFEVDGAEIALFRVDGAFYATEDLCLHAGGPLHAGKLDGRVVTCPWHGWQFDVTDGRCALHGTALRCFATRVRDGVVEIEIQSG
jgi:nitrite reductase/ring-hydroxylating ferredoxin subunit